MLTYMYIVLLLWLPFAENCLFMNSSYTRDPAHSRQVERVMHPGQPDLTKGMNLTQLMHACEIIPNLIDKAPKHLCEIIYEIEHYEEPYPIRTGERMRDYETKKEPVVKWPTRENKLYTLYMVGMTPWTKEGYWHGDFVEEHWNPDHPTKQPQKIQQWEQWIKINIPSHNISGGELILPYLPPRVGDANVTEYYVCLIYEQPQRYMMNSDEWKDMLGHNFNCYHTLRRYATKYRLGDPWAGNFFHGWKKYQIDIGAESL